MNYAKPLNILGLLLSVAGVVLLYWGAIHGQPILMSSNMSVCDVVRMAFNHDIASKWGFIAIIAGTLAQIWATFARR